MSRIDDLYARFESRFRGSRESILERLSAYGPLLSLVEERHPRPVALDCGCGRGEWLEVLVGRGWQARGVDTNERMLAEARGHGLETSRGDAIAYLQGLESKSVQLVSAFHLVEHLPSHLLLTLLTEMSRVLDDDGIVLLETPNPENLAVGTSYFYLDPTHDKPLPPQLLQFYVEECGVPVARILRINGEADPEQFETVEAALRPLLHRALDYAVVGIKSGDTTLIESVDAFIASIQQGNPIALDGVRRLDQFLASRPGSPAIGEPDAQGIRSAVIESRDSLHEAIRGFYNSTRQLDRNVEAATQQREDGMKAAIGESRDSVHEAILAVHNATVLLGQATDAGNRRQEELAGTLASQIAPLHAGLAQLQAAAAEGTRADERNTALVEGLAPTLSATSSSLTALRAEVDRLAQQAAAMQSTSSTHGKRLEGSLREAVATMRRSADAREHRILSALDTLRRSNNELFAERESLRLAAVRSDFETQLEQVRRSAIEETASLYKNTSSWKITAPLRRMVTAARPASRPAPPTRPSTAQSTVRHALLSNPVVWSLGRRAVRLVPGLRMRMLRSLDQQNLLVNPLSTDPADERVPLALYHDDEHAHLDEALRLELMPAAARRVYLRMTHAHTGRRSGASQ